MATTLLLSYLAPDHLPGARAFCAALADTMRHRRAGWQRRNQVTRLAAWVWREQTFVLLVDGREPQAALTALDTSRAADGNQDQQIAFESWLAGWLQWLGGGPIDDWVAQGAAAPLVDTAVGLGAWKEWRR